MSRLGQILLRQPVGALGPHVDPVDPATPPPDRRAWGRLWRAAFASPDMECFRESLRLPGSTDVRASVLDDLATYFQLEPEECVWRSVHWEELSVEEWSARDRSTPAGLADFYRSTTSWAFDLLWFAYLQAEGYAFPATVLVTRFLGQRRGGGRHLDFGSGAGVTGQTFRRLGYESDLADISRSLLDFARFRLERRGDRVGYIDLSETALEPNSYDVITALDTLVHVPDLPDTARRLHRALRPGGWLFANFDVRRQDASEAAWHLYEDEDRLRWDTQRAGFEQRAVLDGITRCYQRVETQGWRHGARGARDTLVLRNPLARGLRRVRWPTPARVRRALARRRRADGHG